MVEPSTDRNRVRARLGSVFANPEPLRVPLSILGVVFLGASFLAPHGWDLHSYWTFEVAHPYAGFTGSLNDLDTFRYAPPIAFLFAPLTAMPWPLAQGVWLAIQLVALYAIAGRWALALIVFPPVWLDITYGNINILLAAAISVGMRHPAAWAWVLLTKVTPGVGLVWFAVRGEWRSLGIVAAATLLLALPTLIVAPQMWVDWLGMLNTSRSVPVPADALAVPLGVRIVGAALLVAWGARTERRWTVGVGATLAMPVLWPISLAVIIAAVPDQYRGFGRAADTQGPVDAPADARPS
jgi:hypothetical protein